MRRDQTQGPHLRRPFLVVVAAPARFSAMVLPLMDHLVHDRRDDFLIGALEERGRVERDLINDLRAAAMAKSLAGEEATAAAATLHREKTAGKLAGEQHLVEVLVGFVEAPLRLIRWAGDLGIVQILVVLSFNAVLYRTIQICHLSLPFCGPVVFARLSTAPPPTSWLWRR